LFAIGLVPAVVPATGDRGKMGFAMGPTPTGHLLVVDRDGGPVYYAKWRLEDGRRSSGASAARGLIAAARASGSDGADALAWGS